MIGIRGAWNSDEGQAGTGTGGAWDSDVGEGHQKGELRGGGGMVSQGGGEGCVGGWK